MRLATSAPVRDSGTSEYLAKRLLSMDWTIRLSTITAIVIIQMVVVDMANSCLCQMQKYNFCSKISDRNVIFVR